MPPSESDIEVNLDPLVEVDSDECDDEQTHHNKSDVSKIVTLIVAFLLEFQIFYKISDNAIVTLLRFFKYLLLSIGRVFEIQALQEITVPQSIYGCRSIAGIAHIPFQTFPVCPACHMLFESNIQKLIVRTEGP